MSRFQFEPWERKFKDCELAADMGGYWTLSSAYKERIVLQREGQIMLRRIAMAKLPNVYFSPITFKSSCANYLIETIPTRPLKSRRKIHEWPKVEERLLVNYSQQFSREKIGLEGQSIKALKGLQRTAPLETTFPQIELLEKNDDEAVIMDHNLIHIEKKQIRRFADMSRIASSSHIQYLTPDNQDSTNEFETLEIENSSGKENTSADSPVADRLTRNICSIDKVQSAVEQTQEKPAQVSSQGTHQDLQARPLDDDFHFLSRTPKEAMRKHCEDPIKELNRDNSKKLSNYVASRVGHEVAIAAKNYQSHEITPTFQRLLTDSINVKESEHKRCGSSSVDLSNSQSPGTHDSSHTVKSKMEENSLRITETNNLSKTPMTSGSSLPLVRSFVYEEHKPSADIKRRRAREGKKKANSGDSGQSSKADIIQTLNRCCKNRLVRQEYNLPQSKRATTEEKHSVKTPFQELSLHCNNKTVLTNLNRVNYNHGIIQHLTNAKKDFGVSIIEQEQSIPYDFVLSPLTCIFRVQLDKFFQMRSSGDLYYEEALRDLLAGFKKIIVLVEYVYAMETTDPDLFWKVRLYLNRPEFEVHLTLSDSEVIGRWILALAEKRAVNAQVFEDSDDTKDILEYSI